MLFDELDEDGNHPVYGTAEETVGIFSYQPDAGGFIQVSEEREREIREAMERGEEWPRARPAEPAAQIPIQKPAPKPSTYLIGIEGSPLVKIGYTGGDPKKRLANLQTGVPMELALLHTWPGDHEGGLHRRFAQYRKRGEWFDLTSLGDPVAVVQAAIDEIQAAETKEQVAATMAGLTAKLDPTALAALHRALGEHLSQPGAGV